MEETTRKANERLTGRRWKQKKAHGIHLGRNKVQVIMHTACGTKYRWLCTQQVGQSTGDSAHSKWVKVQVILYAASFTKYRWFRIHQMGQSTSDSV